MEGKKLGTQLTPSRSRETWRRKGCTYFGEVLMLLDCGLGFSSSLESFKPLELSGTSPFTSLSSCISSSAPKGKALARDSQCEFAAAGEGAGVSTIVRVYLRFTAVLDIIFFTCSVSMSTICLLNAF
jgi:hypothetical protein